MRALIVEDEALVAAEIEFILEEAGIAVAGVAVDLRGARAALDHLSPDLVLLDVHLADGPTGIEVARLARSRDVAVLFMTANRRRLPPDFAGAVGAVAKPYTEWGLKAALMFVAECLERGGATRAAPASLEVSPDWLDRWRAPEAGTTA